MNGISPHGKTDPAIVREIFRVKLGSPSPQHNEIVSILEAYVSFLKDEVRESPHYRVLPGIIPLLQEISPRTDTVLGLATGNVESGARIKLERGRLNSFFSFGGFGSDAEDRTELVRAGANKASDKIGAPLDPSDIYVIGDTPLDIDAGKRCGFKTVGIGTGSYSAADLLASGATFAVSDLAQGHDYFLRSVFIE